MTWKFALRGLIANRPRTMFLLLSLALSSFVLVAGASLVMTMHANIESGLRQGFAGDLQVFDSANPPLEFTAEVPTDFVMIADPAAATRVLLEDPDVAEVAPRSNASGLILAGGYSAPVVLVGIDPVAEARALGLMHREGELAGSGRILLGHPMAERLHRTDSGGEVTVLIPTADGLFEGDRFEVAGTYAPPGLPLLDEFIAFVSFDHLQSLMGYEGHPGSLVARLRRGADPAAAGTRLQRAFDAAGLSLQVRTWDEMAGDLLGMVRVGRYLVGSGFLFVLLVVALGVGNTLLILMLEKTREIGLMRALGTARAQVLRILLAEVTLISFLASAAGAAVGTAVCLALGQVGIPAASRAMTFAFGGDRFYPGVSPEGFLLGFLVVALVGPLAAIGPAIRASGADPAVVMREPA